MKTITYLHPTQNKLRISRTIKPEPISFNEWVKEVLTKKTKKN